jgi:hypothetical protein
MESTFTVASIWVTEQHHDVEATEKVDSTENVTALLANRGERKTGIESEKQKRKKKGKEK